MTGLSMMDKAHENVTSFANGNDIDFVDLSEASNVATLDVTSEEINYNPRSWGSRVDTNKWNLKNFDSNERKRSETWSSGLSDEIDKQKVEENAKARTIKNPKNMSATEKRRSSTPISCEISPTHAISQENINNLSEVLTNDKKMAARKALPELSTFKKKSLSNGSINNTGDCPEVGEECDDLAGFMDINLGKSNSTVNMKIHTQAEHTKPSPASGKKQTRKATFSYIFDWMSPLTSDSTIDQAGTDLRKKDSYETASLKSDDTSSLSYVSATSSSKIPVLNIFQKALKSNSWKQASQLHSKFEPRSTTALILESRPRNLPSKSSDESEKHQAEYNKMVKNVKKHEIKDIEKRMKQLRLQKEYEEQIVTKSLIWINQILPQWSTTCFSTRTRQLWWDGLPPNVRGKVWMLAIGNELNITKELYSIMVARAHDKLRHMSELSNFVDDVEPVEADRECTVDLIRLDISRTFPHLGIFQQGGPYHQVLHDVLGAYACYRPDVGYVQGMSFMAAMLLLNMEPAKAFVVFANILNKPCQVAFFRLNEEMMKTYFATFEVFFEENLPSLFSHFKVNNLTPDMYLIDWIFTMFSKALVLDTASRVWDVFCRDGEGFLFRTAIAILKLNEELLLSMEFIQAAQYLIKLPSNFSHQQLFDVIDSVSMFSRGNRRWKGVLSLMKDAT